MIYDALFKLDGMLPDYDVGTLPISLLK